jgi:hypothetical protein
MHLITTAAAAAKSKNDVVVQTCFISAPSENPIAITIGLVLRTIRQQQTAQEPEQAVRLR